MSSARSALYVEGKNDEKAISSLLKRHGIDTETKTRKFDIGPATTSDEKSTQSVETLITSIYESVRRSANKPMGLVLDADSDIQSRWDAVRFQLKK